MKNIFCADMFNNSQITILSSFLKLSELSVGSWRRSGKSYAKLDRRSKRLVTWTCSVGNAMVSITWALLVMVCNFWKRCAAVYQVPRSSLVQRRWLLIWVSYPATWVVFY